LLATFLGGFALIAKPAHDGWPLFVGYTSGVAGIFAVLNLLVRAWPWLCWTAWSPLANTMVALLGDYAMSSAAMSFPCFVLPWHAYAKNEANCYSGSDWEVHAAFAYACGMQSLVWALWMNPVRAGHLTFLSRALVFFTYVLAMTDMYMDGNFIVVASACGSAWHVKLAIWTYAVGVIATQYVVGTIAFVFRSGWTPMLAPLNYFALLNPPELVVTAKPQAVPGSTDPDENALYLGTIDVHAAGCMLVTLCLTRSIAEDFAQAAIQYDFTLQVKKNALVIFSILSSLGSFLFHVVKALRFYFGH